MSDDSDSFFDSADGPDGGSDDSVRDVSRQGFFSRLWSSIVGIGIGIVLILACVAGIFFNEKSAVDTYRSLAEGQGLAVTVPASPIDPAKDGKLIHTTGALSSQSLTDSDLGVSATAVTLVRHVETYQWKQEENSETKKNLGGSTTTTKTYSYSRAWSDKPIDSSKFRNQNGHANPPMRFAAKTIYAPNAKLGDYKIGDPLLRQLGEGERISLGDTILTTLKSKFSEKLSLAEGAIYFGANSADPQIGDTRVFYTVVPPGNASVVGVQSGNTFTPFQANAGDQILMMRAGTATSDQMFKSAVESNGILHWILRVVIFVLMFAGWNMLFRPFVIMADIIPILGDLLGFGAGLAAFLLTLLTVPLITAIAWLAVRPLMSLAILAAGGGLFYGVRYVLPKKASRQPQQQAATA